MSRWRRLFRHLLHAALSPLMLLWLPPLLLVAVLLWPTIPPALVQWLDQQVPGLTLQGLERIGFSHFRVDHFGLELPLVDIVVEQAEVDFDLRCSWQLRLCVNDAKVQRLAVRWRVPASQWPAADDDVPLLGLPLPFAISIDRLQLAGLQLEGSGLVISASAIALAGHIDEQGIGVQQLQAASLALQLQPSVDVQPAPALDSPQQWLDLLATIALPFVLEVHQAVIGRLQLQLPEQPNLQFDQLQLVGRWHQHHALIHQLEGRWQQYRLALRAGLEFTAPMLLDISAKLSHDQLPPLELSLSGSLLRPKLQLTSAGKHPLLLLAEGRLDRPNWPFALSINGQLPEYIGQQLGLSAQQLRLTLLGDRHYYWLAGSGQLGHNLLSAKVQLRAYGRWLARSNWLLRADNDEGRLAWRGRLHYDQHQLQVAGRWSGHGLSLDRLMEELPRIERIGGGVRFVWRNADDWLLQLFTVRGRFVWRSQQWRLHAGFDVGPQAVNIRRFYLSSPAGRITAFGTADQQWQLRGELDVDPYLLSNLPGRIESLWSISGPWALPALTFKARADLGSGGSKLAIEQLKLDGQLALVAPYQHRWQLTADTLRYGDLSSSTVTASGQGSLQDWQLATAASAGNLQWFLAAGGGLDAQQRLSLELNQAGLTIADRGMALKTPIQFQQQPDGWVLSAHCWRGQPLSLCVDRAFQQGRQGVFSGRIEHLDLGWLAPLLPAEVRMEGDVQGQLAMSRSGQQPWLMAGQLATVGDSQLLLDNEGVEQRYQIPLLQLAVNSDVRRLRLDGQLLIRDHGALQLWLDTANNDAAMADVSGQLQLEQLSLALFDPLLGDQLQLAGVVDGQLQLSGHRQAPQITGRLQASQLQLDAEMLGLIIDDGELVVDVDGDRARLNGQLQADGGSVVISGQLGWLSGLSGELRLAGLNWPVKHELAQLRLDSDLSIEVHQPRLIVAGKVSVREGLIAVQELPPVAVEISSDERIVRAGKAEQSQYWQTLLDVQLQLGSKLRLQAFGLNGWLAGQLQARDKGKGLQLQGEVAVKDGRFKAYGQNLIMRKAALIFNGPPELPVLNVEAIRDPDETEDGVIAGLRVSGMPGRAAVHVFSEPSLAEPRALSYLLQGRDLESGEGGNDMAVAAIGLGIGATGSLVGDVGDVFGVDDLALGTSGSGEDAKVTVGGNLLPGVSVRYGRGIFSAVSELTLRIRLLRNLYLEAVSSTDNALDFIYRFEF